MLVGAALLVLGGCFGVAAAVTAVVNARAQTAAEEAWPEQRRQIEAVVASVVLPPGYEPEACELGVGDRCWRVQRLPSQVTGEVVAALQSAGVADVEHECTEGPEVGSEPMGCAAAGTVAERRVTITATRDLAAATTRTELLSGTSSITLGADFTAP